MAHLFPEGIKGIGVAVVARKLTVGHLVKITGACCAAPCSPTDETAARLRQRAFAQVLLRADGEALTRHAALTAVGVEGDIVSIGCPLCKVCIALCDRCCRIKSRVIRVKPAVKAVAAFGRRANGKIGVKGFCVLHGKLRGAAEIAAVRVKGERMTCNPLGKEGVILRGGHRGILCNKTAALRLRIPTVKGKAFMRRDGQRAGAVAPGGLIFAVKSAIGNLIRARAERTAPASLGASAAVGIEGDLVKSGRPKRGNCGILRRHGCNRLVPAQGVPGLAGRRRSDGRAVFDHAVCIAL